jgi:DNA topoisomerase III
MRSGEALHCAFDYANTVWRSVYHCKLEPAPFCISRFQLSQRNSPNKFVKNYDFSYPQTNSQFTVTSVIGHLLDHDFEAAYSNWQSCDPFVLFDAQIVAKVKKDVETIARNLRSEATRANTLMIWTDCDREGENIGAEIAGVCRKARPGLVIRRARFSAIIAQCVCPYSSPATS